MFRLPPSSFRFFSVAAPLINSTFLSEFRRQAPAARAAGASDKGFLAKQILPVQHLLWDCFSQLYCPLLTCSPFSRSAVHARSFTKFRAGKKHLL